MIHIGISKMSREIDKHPSIKQIPSRNFNTICNNLFLIIYILYSMKPNKLIDLKRVDE